MSTPVYSPNRSWTAYLCPEFVRFVTDGLRVSFVVSVSVRTNMGFLVVFVALFHARGDRVDRNSFSSAFRHDGGKREGCGIGGDELPPLYYCLEWI